MKTRLTLVVFAVVLALNIAHAQSNDAEGKLNVDAMTFRRETAEIVKSGAETPKQVLTRLRDRSTLTGFPISKDVDFAWATMDIGHRLAAAGKFSEALEFFRAAEEALGKAIDQAADTAAAEKAMYLRQRAMIRGQFLQRPADAMTDIENAQKLLPDDKELKRAGETLARDKAEQFKAKEQSTKG